MTNFAAIDFETVVRLAVSLGGYGDLEELKLLRSGNKTPEKRNISAQIRQKAAIFLHFFAIFAG